MSIEYRLILDCDESIASLENFLRTESRLNLSPENGEGSPLVLPGLFSWINSQSDLGKSLIDETFQVASTVSITLRLDKFVKYDISMASLLSVIDAFLLLRTFDLVFLSNGEKPLFLRKSGKVVLNSSDAFWSAILKNRFPDIRFEESRLPIL